MNKAAPTVPAPIVSAGLGRHNRRRDAVGASRLSSQKPSMRNSPAPLGDGGRPAAARA